MLEVWLPLLVCLALGATWYHVLRLRERAHAHARRLCEQHGVQLLDDSVALHRMRVQRRHGSWRVLREYRFETSRGGDDRQAASITLLDNSIVGASMPAHQPIATPPPAATMPLLRPTLPRPEPPSGNVVPFERGRRTLH
ncbi:MAG TPA: DUF3301 domain-containing protein [Rhodanobacteraceae bacterium]|nr:DUF3301 domain-containing protein [Rhodanobacteraceae bacterium]